MTYQVFTSALENKHWIFAFYGYGQQASVYAPLADLCKSRYGLLVIDLPYHMFTSASSKQDFIDEIKKLVAQYNMESITGVSFSIGSRYNLIMAELLPVLVKKIILIAPDGVRINFWNRLATQTIIGNQLFYYFMQHPSFYLKCLHFFYRIKLLPLTLYTFSKWYVRNKENCQKVYNTWMNMKNMVPDLKKIKQEQQQYHFTTVAYFGRYDAVINQKCMKKLINELPDTQVQLLDKDHDLLNDEIFHIIAGNL